MCKRKAIKDGGKSIHVKCTKCGVSIYLTKIFGDERCPTCGERIKIKK